LSCLALLADIHGNLPALEAVLADLAPFRVDHIVVAGDAVNWGPFSAGVMERIAAGGWAAVRGNNEYYLLDYETPRAPTAWRDRDQWPLLPWLKRQLAGRHQTLIAAWPDSLSLRFPDAPPVRVVHGTPRSHSEPIYPAPLSSEAEVAAMLASVEEPLVIAGHTHIPVDRTVGRWRVLNPGSVGVPLDGKHCGRYLLLEAVGGDWRAEFRSVPIDPAPVLREFERQGFRDECGVIGHLVMQEFVSARLELHPFVRWHDAVCPERPLTLDLLEEWEKVTEREPYVLPAYRISDEG
jgi:predicted phosphodiesterase